MDGWFPRLSPDGRHVVSGAAEVFLDGAFVAKGLNPVWLSPFEVIFRDVEEPVLWRHDLLSGSLTRVPVPRGVNLVDANGRGVWVIWCAPAPGLPVSEVRTSNGLVVLGGLGAAVSPDGTQVCATDNDGSIWLHGAGSPTKLGTNAREPRWTEAGLAWVEEHTRYRPELRVLGGWNTINECHRAVVVAVPNSPPYVLALENERLVLYRKGSTACFAVAEEKDPNTKIDSFDRQLKEQKSYIIKGFQHVVEEEEIVHEIIHQGHEEIKELEDEKKKLDIILKDLDDELSEISLHLSLKQKEWERKVGEGCGRDRSHSRFLNRGGAGLGQGGQVGCLW